MKNSTFFIIELIVLILVILNITLLPSDAFQIQKLNPEEIGFYYSLSFLAWLVSIALIIAELLAPVKYKLKYGAFTITVLSFIAIPMQLVIFVVQIEPVITSFFTNLWK